MKLVVLLTFSFLATSALASSGGVAGICQQVLEDLVGKTCTETNGDLKAEAEVAKNVEIIKKKYTRKHNDVNFEKAYKYLLNINTEVGGKESDPDYSKLDCKIDPGICAEFAADINNDKTNVEIVSNCSDPNATFCTAETMDSYENSNNILIAPVVNNDFQFSFAKNSFILETDSKGYSVNNTNNGCKYGAGSNGFLSSCNSFANHLEGLPEINAEVTELSVPLLVIENSVSSKFFSGQDECDSCLGKAFEQFGGKTDNLEKEKNKVRKEAQKRLEKADLARSVYKLSANVEKMLKMDSIYGESIDHILKKDSKNEKDFESAKNELFCMDSKALKTKITEVCGIQGLIAVKKEFGNLLGKSELTLNKSLEKLHSKVASNDNAKCSNGKGVSLAAHQRLMAKTEIKSGSLHIKEAYKALDEIMNSTSLCQKENREEKPPGDFISKVIFHKALNEERNNKSALQTALVKQVEDILKKNKSYADELDKKYKDKENRQNLIYEEIFSRVMHTSAQADPNIELIMSDWDYFCKVSKKKESSDSLIDFIIGPEKTNASNMAGVKPVIHQHHYDRIKEFSDIACKKSYEDIAMSACFKSKSTDLDGKEVFKPKEFSDFKKHDLNIIKRKMFKEYGNESDYKKSVQKKAVLGALACSEMNNQLTDGSVIDPVLYGDHNNSSLGLRLVSEGIDPKDPNYNSQIIRSLTNKSSFNLNSSSEKGLKALCDESADIINQLDLNKILYGVDDKVAKEAAVKEYILNNLDDFEGDEQSIDFAKKNTSGGSSENSSGPKSSDGLVSDKSMSNIDNSVVDAAPVGAPSGSGYQPTQNTQPKDYSKIDQPSPSQIAKMDEEQILNSIDNIDPQVAGGIDSAWEEERAAYLKRISELEGELLTDFKEEASKGGSADFKKIDELEAKLKGLQETRKKLLAKDQQVSKGRNSKSKIVDKPKSGITKSLDQKIKDANLSGNSGSISTNNNSAAISRPRGMKTRSVNVPGFKNGVGGHISIQEADKNAVLSLVEVQDAIKNGDLDVELIKVGDKAKFFKIPGVTGYIAIEDLNKFKDANKDIDLSFLDQYLNAKDLKELDALEKNKKEVMIVSLKEAENPSARLAEMRAAIEFSKIQLACQKGDMSQVEAHKSELRKLPHGRIANIIKCED